MNYQTFLNSPPQSFILIVMHPEYFFKVVTHKIHALRFFHTMIEQPCPQNILKHKMGTDNFLLVYFGDFSIRLCTVPQFIKSYLLCSSFSSFSILYSGQATSGTNFGVLVFDKLYPDDQYE